MIELSYEKNLKSSKNNLVVLDFKDFYYLDISIKEKLSNKDLKRFLEYKIIQEFSLDLDLYEFYYITLLKHESYQVYAVKKNIFSLYKKNILIPKSLAYNSFGGNYFVLIIEEVESRVMLYIDGAFVLSNHIAFCDKDIANENKMQELIIFLKGIISHIRKDNDSIQNANTLYIHLDEKYSQKMEQSISILEEEINVSKILMLKESFFYKKINLNLFSKRVFYKIYPLISSYLAVIVVCCLAIVFGYIGFYLKYKSIEQDTKELQYFYNDRNKDVKQYHILQSSISDAQNTLKTKKNTLADLVGHERGFDITSVLVNVLKTVSKFDVFLQSVVIKNEHSKRWVYVDVMFKDKTKIQKYIASFPNYLIQKISREKDMFTYRVKAEIK